MKKIRAALLLLFPSIVAFAQSETAPADTVPIALKAVEITASRLTLTDAKAPLAVSVLEQKRLQSATQQLSPHEVLAAVPGVFVLNPDNFSQDLRISIRGFGARASFGIRGIRMFTDGLPEGTPDGQVDVDNLDMGIVRQLEVLRGAASGLYGNASGGVIYMLTENPTGRKPLLEAQIGGGSYGFRRFQMKIGQRLGRFSYFLNGSHNRTDGYRAWSTMQNTIFNAKLAYRFAPQTKITLLANLGASPRANDPGGLTQALTDENPRQAGANNLLFETGEQVRQSRTGATFEHRFSDKHSLAARAFFTRRTLLNRLAIAANGYGDLQRQYGGAGLSYQFDEKRGRTFYRFKIGFDLENQADVRKRFSFKKISGPSGDYFSPDTLVLEQLEKFRSAGLFALQEIRTGRRWLFSAGLRYDDLRLSASDRFLKNGDQSGAKNFSRLNPTLGANFQFLEKASAYANFSTAFETPTLNELGNNPENTGGFNPNLKPQRAASAELGAKGLAFNQLRFDFALFRIETENDIVPYQIAGQPGKTFFQNAGKTLRHGLEIGLTWFIVKDLTAYAAQAFSNFEYKKFEANGTAFDGKLLPGLPKSNGQLELRYQPERGFFAIAQGRYASRIYANDANSASANAFAVLNLRLGYLVPVKKMALEPFFGANNLTGTRYMANVQLNAQGERYFEPAARQYFFGGLKLRVL